MKTDNELIAEFMNYLVIQDAELAICRIIKTPHGEVNIHHLLFDSSWDWLMPVVEKIKNLERDWPLLTDDVLSLTIATPINEVYELVVNFVNRYNLQNQ